MRSSLLTAVFVFLALLANDVARAQVFNINNYADNAPGTQFLERGNRFFRQGDYDAAAGYFRLAARWADKMAQFNLGMLYVNGQGVERDPLRGWAWIKLSAERGYPKNVSVAADIWSHFNDDHKKVARRILEEELKPEYGDGVAVPRTSNEMKRTMARTTSGGSRIGVNRAVYVTDRSGNFESADQFFRDARWDFEQIVQFETRLQKAIGRGNVRLREFRTLDDDETSEGLDSAGDGADPQ